MKNKTSRAISERAMLADLAISQWSARRFDGKVSEEVAKQHNTTSAQAGRYNKILITRDSLAAVTKAANAAREYHNRVTLPWNDQGARVLPLKLYEGYVRHIAKLITDFEDAADAFESVYPELRRLAKIRLNGLWQEHDYPADTAIRSKFRIGVEYLPFPSSADFRIQVGDGQRKLLVEATEAKVMEKIAGATGDVWARLMERVKHMADRLDAYDVDAAGKVANPFRDSLVSKLVEIVDLVPALNVIGDDKLNEAAREIRETLCGRGADVLRSDAVQRKATAAKANEILKKMAGYASGVAA